MFGIGAIALTTEHKPGVILLGGLALVVLLGANRLALRGDRLPSGLSLRLPEAEVSFAVKGFALEETSARTVVRCVDRSFSRPQFSFLCY